MLCDVTAYERIIRISWAWYLCWWAVILWGSVESCFQRFLCWGTRKTFFNPFCILHTHLSDSLNQNLFFFFLPDVSLIEEFVPTFLNDVIHQVRLKNPFLQLSVFLKAFYLEDRKSDNLRCYRQVSTAFHFTQILSVLLGSGCAWMVHRWCLPSHRIPLCQRRGPCMWCRLACSVPAVCPETTNTQRGNNHHSQHTSWNLNA